jgi:hypothetical protein
MTVTTLARVWLFIIPHLWQLWIVRIVSTKSKTVTMQDSLALKLNLLGSETGELVPFLLTLSRHKTTMTIRYQYSPMLILKCKKVVKIKWILSLLPALSSTLNWFKFWWEFSLRNSHQLSCNSCSRLTSARELRKLSCKLSLLNSHQLSCNSCSRLTSLPWELRKLSCKLSLLNSHATLVLVWPAYESWEDSRANSRFSTTLMQLLFSSDQRMRVEKTLVQTLDSQQLSCNSCSRLTGAWELRKLSCKLSLLNSHSLEATEYSNNSLLT